MGRDLSYSCIGKLWVPRRKSQWRSLIWQLSWCARSGFLDFFPATKYGDLTVITFQRKNRPQEYYAPSRSLAASDGWNGYSPAFQASSESLHGIINFEILDVSVDLGYLQELFGAVNGGKLVVRDSLKAAKHLPQLVFMPDAAENKE